MKKTICIVTIIMSCLLLLCSCGSDFRMLFIERENIANDTVLQLKEAINENDNKALVNLFSKQAQTNSLSLDLDAQSLIDFIEGDIVEIHSQGGMSRGREAHYGKKREELRYTYVLETTEKKYQIAIKQIIIDDFDVNNVGIVCISVVEDELWNEMFPDYYYNGSRYMEYYGINIHRTVDDLLAEGWNG